MSDVYEGRTYTGYSEWDLQGKRRLRIGDDCVRAYLSSGQEQYQKAAARITELEAQVKRLELSRGRKDAQIATYLSALASESRKGRTEWAQKIVARADARAMAVKQSDLGVAHVSTGDQE